MARKKGKKKISAYQKEVRKLRNRIKTAEKRGFVFDSFKIPRTTKGVQALKGKALRIKADYYINQETGELQTGKQGVEEQKKITHERIKRNKNQHTKKTVEKYHPNYDESMYSNTVINHWYATLEVNRNGKGFHLLSAWGSDMIRQHGRDGFASILTQGASNNTILSRGVAYNESLAQQYIAEMSTYMPENSFNELSEALEEEDGWETGEFPD